MQMLREDINGEEQAIEDVTKRFFADMAYNNDSELQNTLFAEWSGLLLNT